MIVRCERCETRFKLDESRIPVRGARVRCSRCKHAFFVTPPGAAKADVVHEVAAEAARTAAETTRAPEPSWDLEEGPEATLARRKPTVAAAGAEGDAADDTDWRFEDDVPGLDPGATRSSFDLSGAQTAPSLARPDPNEDSLAELGDPETWDLLAGDAPAADLGAPAPSPSFAEPEPEQTLSAPAPAAAVAPAPVAVAADAIAEVVDEPAPTPAPRPRVAPPATRTAFAPPAIVMPRHIPAAPRHPSMTTGAGWAGLAALVVAIAWGALLPAAPALRATSLAPVAGFEIVEARARLVENAAAGPMLVISGRLRNPGPSARPLGASLAVQLLDADGAPLGGRVAPAGPELPEARVREDAPEQLAAAQQAEAAAFAREPVAAGAELAFSALFAPAPAGADGFTLTPPAGAAR